MSYIRNFLTVGGTVGCALGVGFFMQHGLSWMSPADSPGQQLASNTDNLPEGAVIAGLEDIVLTASSPSQEQAPDASDHRASIEYAPEPKFQKTCNLGAVAVAGPMASAKLSVTAPCNANERVSIHHSGLVFTELTDANGNLELMVPAITENAVFLVSFENGKGTVASTHVGDLDAYERIALQWDTDAGFQIHALEFGAGYGEDGHVWADHSARGVGHVVHLGNRKASKAQFAEIYTFPSRESDKTGSVALSIEAEVTQSNCGRDIHAQSLELRRDRKLRSRDFTLTIPDCTAAGDFLVLNNLLQDLKIASK